MKLGAELRAQCAEEFDPFFNALRDCLGRRITRVVALALSGTSVQFPTVQRTIRFVEGYDESTPPSEFHHYELNVSYSNGREVQGTSPNKQDCLDYVRMLYRE